MTRPPDTKQPHTPNTFYFGYFDRLQDYELEREWRQAIEVEVGRRQVMRLAELKRKDPHSFKLAYTQARDWLETHHGYRLAGRNRKWDMNEWSCHFRKVVLAMADQNEARAFERECWAEYRGAYADAKAAGNTHVADQKGTTRQV